MSARPTGVQGGIVKKKFIKNKGDGENKQIHPGSIARRRNREKKKNEEKKRKKEREGNRVYPCPLFLPVPYPFCLNSIPRQRLGLAFPKNNSSL